MRTFARAAAQAEAERRPSAEGIAVQAQPGADLAAVRAQVQAPLEARFGGQWEVVVSSTGWLDAKPLPTAGQKTAEPLPLGAAWDAAHAVAAFPDVIYAEPLLLMRVPSPDEPDANTRLGIWGAPYSAETQRKIDVASELRDWSLTQMKVPAAWQNWRAKREGKTPGDGVLVAHPDTGYTEHTQIKDRIERPGKDFVDAGKADASDPLETDGLLPNPGHGTATASVIVSPAGDAAVDDVRGVAPGARILPMRVSTSVVHFSYHNVSLALEEAVRRGAHVVSMSLGGPASSERLRSAVKQALDEGIIVVSAAGNMVPTVVFPAALPGVVAIAASNPLGMPWRFSSFGEEVTATAPGERVWRALTGLGRTGKPVFSVSRSDGTSYATAAVAGLAALWLSYHGRETLITRYGKQLLPFAFQLLLRETADTRFAFIDGGKGGFGTGIVDAEKLLQADLPTQSRAQQYHDEVMGRGHGSLIDLTLREIGMLLRTPTTPSADGTGLAATAELPPPDAQAVLGVVTALLGDVAAAESALLSELAALIAGAPLLRRRLQFAAQERALPGGSTAFVNGLRRALLGYPLSAALRERLIRAQEVERAVPQESPVPAPAPAVVPTPHVRRLRAYAFDPSLTTRLATAEINQVTIEVPFETQLEPGPVGEYVEVIDVDPATDCAYEPVNLNEPYLLAQDGLSPSEGNPQFHQQMVYAVVMKTIDHFEEALGRPIFWSPLRPWLRESGDRRRAERRLRPDGREDMSDQFVQRLRIYPHALREENAYYSPGKRALLLGYFPAREGDPGNEYPGGIVFTCLSHDVVSHETTHALLDGMHSYFNEPTNPDVFAFHEAFADIVALFQHFTYPEVLRDQIARTQGRLSSQNLMAELARQFGMATGRRHALRDAIGGLAEKAAQATRTVAAPAGPADAPPEKPSWKRYEPDPRLLDRPGYAEEAHGRGSILVAAVFDAFLGIYDARVADLIRIATGGTGVLPEGRLHPDLVNRMAGEAARSARHVLRMCIRAMDYVPPVDITFGEFLRALITADRDLVPNDERNYRVAFIEAFRAWGIYPRDVRTLSEESLTWHSPPGLYLFQPAPGAAAADENARLSESSIVRRLQQSLLRWKPGSGRKDVFDNILLAQRTLQNYLANIYRQPDTKRRTGQSLHPLGAKLRDLLRANSEEPLSEGDNFSVANLRPARRIGPNGEFRTEMVFEVVKSIDVPLDERQPDGASFRFRGGITFVVSLENDADQHGWQVRYIIGKNVDSPTRQRRQRQYEQQAPSLGFGAAEYHCVDMPEGWQRDRGTEREAMRASSCDCRSRTQRQQLAEPFAMLHRRADED